MQRVIYFKVSRIYQFAWSLTFPEAECLKHTGRIKLNKAYDGSVKIKHIYFNTSFKR